MQINLVIHTGQRSDKKLFNLTGRVVIGRRGDLWKLEDPSCSRRHCSIELTREGQLVLRDLRSANGTQVNGSTVEKIVLHAGDKIRVGDTLIVIQFLEPDPKNAPGEILHGSEALFQCLPPEKQDAFSELGFQTSSLA